MIENLDEHIVGIAIGLRFRANFVIEDQLGKIADSILYSKDAYFNPKVFPKAQPAPSSKELFNEITQDYLHIDHSNVILEINFHERGFSKNELNNIIINFDKQIIKGVLKEYSITQIARIGFVKRYIFADKNLADSFIRATISNRLDGVNDINLRFTKKIPLVVSLAKKEVDDYDNAIFNIIKRADLPEIFMSLDYQRLFDPYLPSSSMIEFQSFIEKANDYNSEHFLKWVNNYTEEPDYA